jgi:hypothetical protein
VPILNLSKLGVPSKVVIDVSIIGPKVVLIQEIIPIGFENKNI